MIARIEARADIELLALGIGHDVTDYYRHAVMLDDEERLGNMMIEQLGRLFARADANRGRTEAKCGSPSFNPTLR